MKPQTLFFTLIGASAFSLMGCSDSSQEKNTPTQTGAIQTEKTAATLTGPLNAYLETFPQCFVIHNQLQKLPGEIQVPPVTKGDKSSAPPMELFAEQNPGVAELEKQGLITLSPTEREEKSIFGDKSVMRYYVQVDLTGQGESFYRPLVLNPSQGLRATFCYAKKVLNQIDDVQENTDPAGKKVALVQYGYHIEDIAPWAQTPEFAAAYPEATEAIKTAEEIKTARAVFTMDENKQWVSAH